MSEVINRGDAISALVVVGAQVANRHELFGLLGVVQEVGFSLEEYQAAKVPAAKVDAGVELNRGETLERVLEGGLVCLSSYVREVSDGSAAVQGFLKGLLALGYSRQDVMGGVDALVLKRPTELRQ